MDLPLKRYWDLLITYLKPLRLKVVLLAVLIFTSIGLHIVNPQIIRYFIDTAIETSDRQPLLLAALAFLAAAFLLLCLYVATGVVQNHLLRQLDLPTAAEFAAVAVVGLAIVVVAHAAS